MSKPKQKDRKYTLEDEVIVEIRGALKIDLQALGIDHYMSQKTIKAKIAKEIMSILDEHSVGVSPVIMDLKIIDSTAETRSVLKITEKNKLE